MPTFRNTRFHLHRQLGVCRNFQWAASCIKADIAYNSQNCSHQNRYVIHSKTTVEVALTRDCDTQCQNATFQCPPSEFLQVAGIRCSHISVVITSPKTCKQKFNWIRNSSDTDVRNTYITLTVRNVDNFIDRLHTRNGSKCETFCMRLKPINSDYPEFPSKVTVLFLLLVST
jgi:hypothetical protein